MDQLVQISNLYFISCQNELKNTHDVEIYDPVILDWQESFYRSSSSKYHKKRKLIHFKVRSCYQWAIYSKVEMK